ncbi:multidrug efflux system subunit MdtA [compost metagenome]
MQVRATLANPEGKLLPGMFTSLQVLLPDPQPQVVVPESAVTYTLYGNSVYVAVPQKTDDAQPPHNADDQPPALIAERRFVETGERRDGLVVISKGLKPGETVVTAGQLKLTQGAAISISPDKTQAAPNSQSRVN